MGYAEDFLQLKTLIKTKKKRNYNCIPINLKKTIIDKIKTKDYSVNEASIILKCSKRNIRNWIKKSKLLNLDN